MVKKTKENQEAETESLQTKWQKRFSLAKSNQAKQSKRFAEFYDVFNARVVTETAMWRSRPYLPIVAQQVWALVAKFSAMRPGFEVKIRNDEDDDTALEEKAAASKSKLEYDYDCPEMDEPMRDKLATVLLDACVTGTAIAKVPYKTKKRERFERMIDEDGIADLTKEKVIESIVGYNDFEPVNVFNVFVSPATDRLNKGWLILRDFVPISDLEATNKLRGGSFYQNLKNISGTPSYAEFSEYNNARNRLTNQDDPSDSTTDIATTYECYEGDMVYLFAESKDSKAQKGWVLLRASKNYYWHGKWPIVKFVLKKRPFEFWGQGLVELTQRLQTIYNDVFAHYLDAWNLTNNPSFWINEDSDVDDYIVEPGSLNTYSGQTPPQPINFNKPDPNSVTMIMEFLNQAIEGVTASQYATGMANSSSDKTKGTATGIMRLQEAAGDIVGYMRENLMTALLQVGKMWHSNNQQFMSQPMNVVVNDKGARKNVQVKPADIQGEADIYVDSASMMPKSDEEKRNDILGRNGQLLQMQQASMAQAQQIGTQPLILNFSELAEDTGEAFGTRSVNKLIMSEDQVKQYLAEKEKKAALEAQNAGMGMPQDPDKATQMIAGELAQQGVIDPEEMMKLEQQQEMQNATIRPSTAPQYS